MVAVADETLLLDTARIREKREKLGLTMEEAADAAGLGTEGTNRRQYWYMLESGRRQNVTLETVARVAKALRCRPKELLREEKPE